MSERFKFEQISDDSTFRLAPWCTVRNQPDQVLIYNARTDELHLVPDEAFAVVKLCVAGAPLGAVIDKVADAAAVTRDQAAPPVLRFFRDLLARGIVEVHGDERD